MSHSNLLQQFESHLNNSNLNLQELSKLSTELKIWAVSVDLEKELQAKNIDLFKSMRKFEELSVIYCIKARKFDDLENAFKRLRFYTEDL
mmetsp:Transcript_10498/g.9042  ORF Transcript_10498/g.9042 Transcript_10498/m.9042 type:complete len:90 (+) Transcript_10498:25-294(+)